LYDTFYRRLGVHDQVRTLVYDGPFFLAWVGGLRRSDQPPYSGPEVARLNSILPTLRAAIRAADQLQKSELGEAPAHVVVQSNGRVEWLSAAAHRWMDEERKEALVSAVRRFDSRAGNPSPVIWDSQADIVRLDGNQGVRYLVSLRPHHPVMRRRLTPRQKEVASLAANGAANKEIAAELGISPHTVRQHLKATYRALAVTNRIELRRELNQHPHGQEDR